jgi:hypothetical protein
MKGNLKRIRSHQRRYSVFVQDSCQDRRPHVEHDGNTACFTDSETGLQKFSGNVAAGLLRIFLLPGFIEKINTNGDENRNPEKEDLTMKNGLK